MSTQKGPKNRIRAHELVEAWATIIETIDSIAANDPDLLDHWSYEIKGIITSITIAKLNEEMSRIEPKK